MSEPEVRRRLRIAGRVQGVGFRWFVRAQARELGLSGWVRNEHDGSVLCEVQGPVERIDEMLAKLRRGPPAARVHDIVADERTLEHDEDDFAIQR